MENNSGEQPFVATDTDNLDAFNEVLQGRAKPQERVEDNSASEPDNAQEDTVEGLEEDFEEPVKPKKKTAKDRIDELTAEKHELKRLLEEAQKAPKPAELVKPAEQNTTPSEKTAPTAEDLKEDGTPLYPLGDFDPQFIRDLTKFTISQENEAARARDAALKQEQDRQQYVAQLDQTWASKITEIEDTLPDFREKGAALEREFSGLDPNYGEFLASTIKGMDEGPQVLYHLANNPEEAKRIVALGPIGAAVALGRLEARFDKTAETKPRVSAAPKPAPTARGMAVGGSTPADTDDLDAFEQQFFTTKKKAF